MSKKSQPQELINSTPQDAGLPAPFTVDELRKDVMSVFFCTLRKLGHMVSTEVAWRLVGKESIKDLSYVMDIEAEPEHFGLTYDTIRDTDFARYIEAMYFYGYYGILDISVEAMDYETVFTWTAAILDDAANSRYLEEWESYGATDSRSAANCLLVAEVANARRILEGNGHFYYFRGKDGTSTDSDVLDVRQMALLSGFEEMSIRAAANPNRPNRLVKLDLPNQTRFSIEEAKRWLQARGRYVSITTRWAGGEVDLTKRPFANTLDAYGVIGSRLRFLDAKSEESKAWECYLELGTRFGYGFIDDRSFMDEAFLTQAAEILQFQPDLFVLRMREAHAREELEQVKHKLRELELESK